MTNIAVNLVYMFECLQSIFWRVVIEVEEWVGEVGEELSIFD